MMQINLEEYSLVIVLVTCICCILLINHVKIECFFVVLVSDTVKDSYWYDTSRITDQKENN